MIIKFDIGFLHNKLPIYLLLLLLNIYFVSCAKINTTSYSDKPAKTLRNYNALEITDFVSYNPEISDDLKTILPQVIENKLQGSNIGFQSVKYGPINDISPNKTLVMLAEIKGINSATKFKYNKGTLKFGEASLSLELALVQKDTGQEILTGEVAGYSTGGLLGSKGDNEKIINDIASEIVNMIASNY